MELPLPAESGEVEGDQLAEPPGGVLHAQVRQVQQRLERKQFLHGGLSDALHRFVELDALLGRDAAVGA